MATIGRVNIIAGESIIEWKIRDFFSLPAKVNTEYISPLFSFANVSWCLNIFPNGEGKAKSVGYIDLYLERESFGRPIKLTFTLGIKNWYDKIDKEIDFTYVFKKPDTYGYSEFLRRSELLRRRSELAPSDVLTVICKLKYSETTEVISLGNAVTPKCYFCKATLQAHEDVSSHGVKCLDKPIKCPECGDVVPLRNWYDHKCQMVGAEGSSNAVTAKCCFCNLTLQAHENISSHEEKCLHKPIKCPECGDVILLKNWHDHKCQLVGAEGKTSTTKCPNCRENLDAENISWHEIVCPGNPTEVLVSCDTITSQNVDDIEFQMVNATGTTATAMCSYCKKLFEENGILMHEKVCMDKPIKCQECCDMITLRSMYDHKCQMGRTKGEQINSEHSETASVSPPESTNKPMKCANCSVTIDSEKGYDHKYLMERAEAIQKLLHDLKGLMLSGDHSNVTVKVKEEEFRLHKCILSARNPFFAMMFKDEMKEKTADTIHITDCEPNQFRSLIHYIYTGAADKLSPENVCDLYEMADLYQEEQLKAECLQLLTNALTVDNFCDVIVLALKHNEQELFKTVTEFFSCNAKEVIRNSKWKSFFKNYPEQADELYMKALDYDNT